jgi:hypothetical protein
MRSHLSWLSVLRVINTYARVLSLTVRSENCDSGIADDSEQRPRKFQPLRTYLYLK